MKKFIIASLLSVCMLFSLATVSMAAGLADVKTTSEAITGASGACEKLGSVTFTFKAGSVIKDGDWWYADLPLGVTVCHTIDYAILGAVGQVPGPGGFGTITPANGATVTNGFYSVKDLGTNAVGDGITVAGPGLIWFRVSAASGSHRLLIQAFDSEALLPVLPNTLAYLETANSDGDTSLTVLPDSEFTIKILDGNFQLVGGPWGKNDTPIGAAAKNGVYGDAAGTADNLGVTNAWDNTLCATSFGHTSATVNVSLNSGGFSGPNFITFNPTNPEVAHMISATSISLAACKADLFGLVSLTGGQAAVCTFDYETPTNYCGDLVITGPGVFKGSTVSGNKILIQNSTGTFYDALDNYQMILQISGNGAYWGGTAPVVTGYTPTNLTQCNNDASGGAAIATAWTVVTETAATPGAIPTGAGCGAIAPASQYIRLTSAAFSGIDTYNQLEVNLPPIVYDPARFVAGGQVTVTVTLNRLPCGTVFTGTRVVAQFAATCPSAAAGTRLLFPYATPLSDNTWWFGLSIANPALTNSVAGTAVITVYEDDGDIGTYTTPSILVGDMVTYDGVQLLGLLTPNTANVGTLGNTRCHIIVNCNFLGAGGFAMMGNGTESTGYVPYGNSASWNY